MGLIVSIIAVAIYAFYALKNYDKLSTGLQEEIEDFWGINVNGIVWVVVLGIIIGGIARIFWPLFVALAVGCLAFFWVTDKDKVKQFFKDLF